MSSIDGGGGTVRRTMDFVGLITAKGRSRGLRGKNTADLCGKPLVAWSIDAAMASRMISAVFVSTENEQIKGISKQLGAYVIPRPHDLCGDSTTSDEVIAHAIPCIMESREDANVGIVLLQPFLSRAECDWYKGRADAVYQNLYYIEDRRINEVLNFGW